MSVNARRARIPTPSGYAPLKSGWVAISRLEHVVVLERRRPLTRQQGRDLLVGSYVDRGDYQVMVPEPEVNLTML